MKKKIICIVLYGLLAAACCVFLVFTIKNMYTTHLSLKQIKQIFSVISTLIWQINIRCANFDFSVRESLEKIKKKKSRPKRRIFNQEV